MTVSESSSGVSEELYVGVEVITEYSSEVLLVETRYDDDTIVSELVGVELCPEVLSFDPVG